MSSPVLFERDGFHKMPRAIRKMRKLGGQVIRHRIEAYPRLRFGKWPSPSARMAISPRPPKAGRVCKLRQATAEFARDADVLNGFFCGTDNLRRAR
jgi:hypothetical protein